jgi:RNA polymerase sigma-B factor
VAPLPGTGHRDPSPGARRYPRAVLGQLQEGRHRTVDSPGAAADLAAACDRLAARLSVPREDGRGRLRLSGASGSPAVGAELWLLHVRFARTRSQHERRQLVEQYEAHARALARRFYRNWEPLDDLEQVALEALLLALERFDPDRGMPFLGFANPTIIGSLKRYYRDTGWAVRVPRRVHDLSRPLRDAWELLSQDLNRSPTPSELADLLGVELQAVVDALSAETMRSTGSLDGHAGDETSRLEHALGRHDTDLELVENRHALEQSLVLLSDGDRELLRLYYEEGRTQAEIAELRGVSQMQISRSITRVLGRLRSHLPRT